MKIPRTWQPSVETREWARTEILRFASTLDLDMAIDFFRDWYLANGLDQAEWDPKFRNWIRKDIKDGSTKRKPTRAVRSAQEYAGITRLGHPRPDSRPLPEV